MRRPSRFSRRKHRPLDRAFSLMEMLLVVTIMVILFSIGMGILGSDRKPLAMKAASRTILAQWEQARQTAQAKGLPSRLFLGPITSEGKAAGESLRVLVAVNMPLETAPDTERWVATGRPLRVTNTLSLDLASSVGVTALSASPDGGPEATWASLSLSEAPNLPLPLPSLVLLLGEPGPKHLKTTLRISQTGHATLVDSQP